MKTVSIKVVQKWSVETNSDHDDSMIQYNNGWYFKCFNIVNITYSYLQESYQKHQY